MIIDNNSKRHYVLCPLYFIGMLLLARDCSIENRFHDKGNYVKLLDHVLIFKKSCGNTIKVRFDHCSLHANLLRARGPQLKFTLKSNLIFFTFRPFFSLIYFFYFFFLCFFFFTFFALFSLFSYFPSFIVTFSHFFSFFSFLYFYIAYGKAFGSRWQTLIKSHSPCWGFFYD